MMEFDEKRGLTFRGLTLTYAQVRDSFAVLAKITVRCASRTHYKTGASVFTWMHVGACRAHCMYREASKENSPPTAGNHRWQPACSRI